MAVSRQQLDRLAAIAKAHKRELRSLERYASGEIKSISTALEQRMLTTISQWPGAANPRTQAELMSAIRRIVREAGKEAGDVLERMTPDISRAALATAQGTTAVLLVGQVDRLERAAQVFASFEESIKTRTLLKLGGPLEGAGANYRAAWGEAWDADWTRTVRSLQGTFTRATVQGLDWRKVAPQITDKLGNLDINGKMDPAVFAEAFARTKITEIMNDSSVAIGAEGEMELFINVGVVDDAQSDECFDACNAGAMTLAEWEASEFGPPPRHVLNCRCTLTPVPFDPKIQWSRTADNKTTIGVD